MTHLGRTNRTTLAVAIAGVVAMTAAGCGASGAETADRTTLEW